MPLMFMPPCRAAGAARVLDLGMAGGYRAEAGTDRMRGDEDYGKQDQESDQLHMAISSIKVITTPMVTRQPTVTAGDRRNCPTAPPATLPPPMAAASQATAWPPTAA